MFNVYGPGDHQPHVIPYVIHQLQAAKAAKEEPTIVRVGRISSERDFVYLDDAVEALRRLVITPRNHAIYNIATGHSFTVAAVIQTLASLLGRKISPVTDATLLRPTDPMTLRADISAIKRDIAWEPQRTLQEGLRTTLKGEGLLSPTPAKQ